MVSTKVKREDVIIVGFGPAGTAAALQLHSEGYERIRVIDPSKHIGAGRLNEPKITSNSAGDDFVSKLLRLMPEAIDIPGIKKLVGIDEPVYLPTVAPPLEEVARRALEARYARHTKAFANTISQDKHGNWVVITNEGVFVAPNLVIATGAKEVLHELLVDRAAESTFLSGDVLSERRIGDLKTALGSRRNVMIFGGAHSAYSAAAKLLDDHSDHVDTIEIFVRSKTKPFIKDRSEADDLEEIIGYTVAGEDSFDQESGSWNRYSGVRGKAKGVWLQAKAEAHTKRGIIIHERSPMEQVLAGGIDEEVPIIQATGYKPNIPGLLDRKNRSINCVARYQRSSGLSTLNDPDTGEKIPGVAIIGQGTDTGHLPNGVNIFYSAAEDLSRTLAR